MGEIAVHRNAAEELQAAAAYYEGRVEGLGADFLDEIEQGFRRIRQFPGLWPIYDGEYRRYLLQRFPYGLIYRVEAEKIFIIAVAHLQRKPDYWKGRS